VKSISERIREIADYPYYRFGILGETLRALANELDQKAGKAKAALEWDDPEAIAVLAQIGSIKGAE